MDGERIFFLENTATAQAERDTHTEREKEKERKTKKNRDRHRNQAKIERKREEGRKEMFCLMTHSTHFIYGYMASYIW